LVNGQTVVEGGKLNTADVEIVAGELSTASKRLIGKASQPVRRKTG
jgi:hypothetical protein